jgi:hypothetical protein
MGDEEKLLIYLNSALKVLSGLDIFPRGTKKKLNFVDQCYLLNPIPEAALSKTWVCGRCHAGYVGSNPVGAMYFCFSAYGRAEELFESRCSN